jgi:Glycine cleavage H-protein
MFPWNYGFHWGPGTVIFLGAFYCVLAVIAATVGAAFLRARRDLRSHTEDRVRWSEDFHDLPPRDRVCRHVLTGEFKTRECPNAFDCRECETHARLIEKHPLPPAEGDREVFGMSFPLDRFYHRGHTWAHLEPDGAVTIGIDDLGKRLLGTPDAIDLPQPGARIHANGTAFRVRKREADVRVISPIDGEVIETGGPGSDWYLRVRPDPLDMRHLLRGPEVQAWILREMERLQLALAEEGAASPTLADGGVPVADISASYPEADWDAVCGEMFLQA